MIIGFETEIFVDVNRFFNFAEQQHLRNSSNNLDRYNKNTYTCRDLLTM